MDLDEIKSEIEYLEQPPEWLRRRLYRNRAKSALKPGIKRDEAENLYKVLLSISQRQHRLKQVAENKSA